MVELDASVSQSFSFHSSIQCLVSTDYNMFLVVYGILVQIEQTKNILHHGNTVRELSGLKIFSVKTC